MYAALADLVVLAHLGWILFLLLGAVAGRRVRWVRRLHLAGIGFALVLTAGGWICPLTHLEVWLRRRAGSAGFGGTFIRHYVERVVYLDVPRWAVLTGIVGVVLYSLLLYVRADAKRRR